MLFVRFLKFIYLYSITNKSFFNLFRFPQPEKYIQKPCCCKECYQYCSTKTKSGAHLISKNLGQNGKKVSQTTFLKDFSGSRELFGLISLASESESFERFNFLLIESILSNGGKSIVLDPSIKTWMDENRNEDYVQQTPNSEKTLEDVFLTPFYSNNTPQTTITTMTEERENSRRGSLHIASLLDLMGKDIEREMRRFFEKNQDKRVFIGSYYHELTSKLIFSEKYSPLLYHFYATVPESANPNRFKLNMVLDTNLKNRNSSYNFVQDLNSVLAHHSHTTQREQTRGSLAGIFNSCTTTNMITSRMGSMSIDCIKSNARDVFLKKRMGWCQDNFKYKENGNLVYNATDGIFSEIPCVNNPPILDDIIAVNCQAFPRILCLSEKTIYEGSDYSFDKTFRENKKEKRIEVPPYNEEDFRCVSSARCLPIPLENLKSNNVVSSAKYMLIANFIYENLLSESINSQREALENNTLEGTEEEKDIIRKSFDALENSEGMMIRFSGDYEYYPHIRSLLLMCDKYNEMNQQERLSNCVEHFPCEFFSKICYQSDLFHNVQAMINHIIGLPNAKTKVVPIPLWNDIFLDVYTKATGEPKYPFNMDFTFDMKFELIASVERVFEQNRDSLMSMVVTSGKKTSSGLEVDEFFWGPNAMAKEMFDEDGDVLNCCYARPAFYLTLFDELLPLLISSFNLQNSPNEENILLLFRLLHRASFILGNTNYEKSNLFMINMLEYQKKNMPAVFKATVHTLKNLQSVSLEYVHATLATALNIRSPDNFKETNRLMMSFPALEDAHLMEAKRYGISTKKSYSTSLKGYKYDVASLECLKSLFATIANLQNTYELSDIPSYPFLFKGKIHLPQPPRRDHVREFNYGLIHIDAKNILPCANDVLCGEDPEDPNHIRECFAKIFSAPKGLNLLKSMQELSSFFKEQQEQQVPFPGVSNEESGCNMMHASGKLSLSKRIRKMRKSLSGRKQRSKEHRDDILSESAILDIMKNEKQFRKEKKKSEKNNCHSESLKRITEKLKTKYEEYYEGKTNVEIWESVKNFVKKEKLKKNKTIGKKRKRQAEALEELTQKETKRSAASERAFNELYFQSM